MYPIVYPLRISSAICVSTALELQMASRGKYAVPPVARVSFRSTSGFASCRIDRQADRVDDRVGL